MSFHEGIDIECPIFAFEAMANSDGEQKANSGIVSHVHSELI